MILAVVVGTGWAADTDLQACCARVGAAGCPTELLTVGAGSSVGAGGNVKGLWHLKCSAPSSFDPVGALSTQPVPAQNTVLTALSAPQAACFDRACGLPEGLCLATGADGRAAVVGCADRLPPTDGMWKNPPKTPAGAVFVGGRLLGTDVLEVARPASSASPTAAITATVPPMPPTPCVPNPALRDASNQQVEAGNSAVVAGDPGQALDRYRAAISMNQCNAFAWVALGDGLLEIGNAERARAALIVATKLMPTHFHAWTSLGEADEKLGDRDAARRAYQQALAAKPGHPPAVAGLSRVGG